MKWVDTERGLAAVVDDAGGRSIIAVDTEADSLHSYFEKVCLIQLSTEAENWVIDPLAVDPAPLGAILADRSITKIFHGADYDLRILNRDFSFEIANIVDTMICAQLIGETAIGLAALLKKYFDVDVDKSHQRADWSKRPLSPAMLEYAANDTKHLIALVSALRTELERLDRWSWATEEFERLEAVRYAASDDDGERYRKLKGANRLDRRGLEILARLHGWRDSVARRRDVPPFKVIGNDALVALAREKPVSGEALEAIAAVPRPLVKRYSRNLLGVVAEAMKVPDADLPEKTVGKPWIRDREADRRIERLKKVRDRIAGDLGIETHVLAPKHLLSAIVEASPRNVGDLEGIPALREWQKRVIGPALVSELATGDGVR